MKKSSTICSFLLACLLAQNASAQVRTFEALTSKNEAGFFKEAKSYFKDVTLQKIDVAALRRELASAPVENRLSTNTVSIEVPMPDGKPEIFDMFESALLAPHVAEQHPDIKTYFGRSRSDKNMNINLTITSSGMSAIILNTPQGAAYIEKVTGYSRADYYRSYYAKDAISPWSKNKKRIQCFGPGGEHTESKGIIPQPASMRTSANIGIGNNSVGGQLRTFRLAIAVTGEFTKKHGNSKTQAYNDIVAYIARVNAVYKNELSVAFQIVSGTELVYDNPDGDPYTGTNTSSMLDENQTNLTNLNLLNTFDLAAAVSATFSTNPVGNSSGGGIASLASLGVDNDKAKNAIEEGDWETNGTSFSQLYTDQVFAHEIGHQFDMPHTFNSNLGSCAGNGSTDGNVEPGSGTTIMSYGYTCSSDAGNDDYAESGLPAGPLLNFHAGSFARATRYLATIPAVGVTTTLANTAPVISVPAVSYTVPKSTPFTLTGTATDAEGDPLTYSWEGIDIGTTATPDPGVFADDTKPPFFRSYAPSAAGNTRSFPVLSAILDGTNKAKGEKLPSVTFATTHRLTVRDNNVNGGGVSNIDVSVNVDGSIGPFLVSNDWSGSVTGGTTKTVEWNVGGTNNSSAPVRTVGTTAFVGVPNVKILLSTDGGQSFPTVLAPSVPNTGNASVTIPSVSTSAARIKVEAIGNIFFDISNQNFTITKTLPVTLVAFNAEKAENAARLSWKTTHESNASHFEVEKSNDGHNFGMIGRIEAAGNSTKNSDYTFDDRQFADQTSMAYYRIRMVDFDRSFAYSRVVSLEGTNTHAIFAYPNPAKGIVTIKNSDAILGTEASLVTTSGKVLRKFIIDKQNFSLDITSYSPGLYILKTKNGNVTKLVKE